MRALELFCGIGGCAAALQGRATVVGAVDHDRRALSVYQRNFEHPVIVRNLSSVRPAQLPQADLWWMSPPCQPYTVRGARRDLDDRRAESLVHLMRLLPQQAPSYVALENVPLFHGSRAHALVRQTLLGMGYTIVERMLCPSELGVPAQRRRFYMVAGRDLMEPTAVPVERTRLADYLDDDPDPALFLTEPFLGRYGDALHVVDRRDEDAVAACFTSAYGHSPVYAGSYLREADGRLRRLSPVELLRLLGFGPRFTLPALSERHAYKLVGNSLSVPAVGTVLSVIPGLR